MGDFDGDTDFSDSHDAGVGGVSADRGAAEVWNNLAADQPAPSPAPVIEPPVSWPAERRARWETFSPEDRAWLAAREKEAHTKITTQGQELQRLRGEYERLCSDDSKYGQYQQELHTLQGRYREQLAEIARGDNDALFEKFAQDRPYLRDPRFQHEVANEMRALLAEVPGLKDRPEMWLKFAHDRLAERTGLPQQLETQRQQQQRQAEEPRAQEQQQQRQQLEAYIRQRDQQWEAVLVQREAEYLQRQAELDQQQQFSRAEHARMAKRAASVNVKGSPGHGGRNPKSVDDTLKEIADRVYADWVH